MPLAVILELLRLKQRVNQIGEKKEGGDATNDVVHLSFSLKTVAGFGEQPAEHEESQSD
jgi:hypothetical protein